MQGRHPRAARPGRAAGGRLAALLLVLLAALVLAGPPLLAARERLALAASSLELPGAPAALVSADLSGDGLLDLIVVVAYSEWDQISVEETAVMDQVEGLVEMMTIVPALFDRRELFVFLGRPEGGFVRHGGALALDTSVSGIEAGPPGLPVVALTDAGLSLLRLRPLEGPHVSAPPAELVPFLAAPSVLSGSGSLLPTLDLFVDLDGDGTLDLLLPEPDHLAVHLAGALASAAVSGNAARAVPASRLPLPEPEGGPLSSLEREYPLPLVEDVDGVELGAGVRAWDLTLPGTLIDHVAACSEGECELWLLVRLVPESAPAQSDAAEKGEADRQEGSGDARTAGDTRSDSEPPTALLRYLQGEKQGTVEWWAARLPPELEAVAALDLDGDGTVEPILGERGRLLAMAPVSGGRGGSAGNGDDGASGELQPLLASRGLRLRTIKALLLPGDALLPVPGVGVLRLYRVEQRRAILEHEAPLPVAVRRGAASLHLATPRIHRLSRARFAVGPEPFGPLRWRTTLIERSASGAGFESRETFARRALPERPEAARYLEIGETPLLLAHSLRSDKVGIFERKKVRLFPLHADRTRSGAVAILAVDTVSRIWQDLGSELVDADADGLVDLVLLQRGVLILALEP